MLKNRQMYDSADMAELYITYRLSWDAHVLDTILDFCKEQETADFSLALDVGCGSGQSAVPLTKHFSKVIGLDISPAMISRAPAHIPNLSFRLGQGEDLSFVGSGSVDLVLVATALHWMDVERLHEEVARVLKPGGAFVVVSYHMPRLEEPRAQEILDTFDNHVMEHHAPLNLKREFTKLFQNYTPPFPGSRRVEGLKMDRTWTVDDLVGFISSVTPSHLQCLQDLSDTPPYNIKQRLQEVFRDEKGAERQIKLTFPLLLFMGHKPQA